MVSIDNGASWGKVFEIEDFDRRKFNVTSNLPETPEEEILRAHEEKVFEKIQSQDSETDAIAGLAYIGNMKAGKVSDSQVEERVNEEEVDNQDNKNTQFIIDLINLSPRPTKNDKTNYLSTSWFGLN